VGDPGRRVRARGSRSRAGRSGSSPAALALLCVPTTLAVPRAYLGWSARASALPLVPERGVLVPRERGLRPLFDAEARADPRAVVLVPPTFPGAQAGEGLVQGDALAPALRHPLFVDLPQIHNERIPDLPERLDLLDGALAGSGEAIARIRSIVRGRPLLVLVEDADAAFEQTLARAGAARVARGEGAAMWTFPAWRE
jgi:hypothetical protein